MLFVVGLLGGFLLNVNQITTYVKENVGFSIVLNKNIKPQEVKHIKDLLDTEPFVKESVFSLTEQINKLETENKFLHKENDAIKVLFSELKENTGIALKEVFEQPTKEPVKKKKNVFKKEETNIFVKQIKK